MKIEKQFTPMKYYGDKRNKDDIIYIVVQTIENRPITHYQIVDGKVIQKIPDDYTSDAINGPRLCKFGYLHGICTKYNCISIGISDHLSEDDIQMCLHLIMTMKQRYRIKNECIVRQVDVTGEANPEIWYDHDKWKADIKDKLIEI